MYIQYISVAGTPFNEISSSFAKIELLAPYLRSNLHL